VVFLLRVNAILQIYADVTGSPIHTKSRATLPRARLQYQHSHAMLSFPNCDTLALLVLSISALYCIYAYIRHKNVGCFALEGHEKIRKGFINNAETTKTEMSKTPMKLFEPVATGKEEHQHVAPPLTSLIQQDPETSEPESEWEDDDAYDDEASDRYMIPSRACSLQNSAGRPTCAIRKSRNALQLGSAKELEELVDADFGSASTRGIRVVKGDTEIIFGDENENEDI
jgi:hypothetical protein